MRVPSPSPTGGGSLGGGGGVPAPSPGGGVGSPLPPGSLGSVEPPVDPVSEPEPGEAPDSCSPEPESEPEPEPVSPPSPEPPPGVSVADGWPPGVVWEGGLAMVWLDPPGLRRWPFNEELLPFGREVDPSPAGASCRAWALGGEGPLPIELPATIVPVVTIATSPSLTAAARPVPPATSVAPGIAASRTSAGGTSPPIASRSEFRARWI